MSIIMVHKFDISRLKHIICEEEKLNGNRREFSEMYSVK